MWCVIAIVGAVAFVAIVWNLADRFDDAVYGAIPKQPHEKSQPKHRATRPLSHAEEIMQREAEQGQGSNTREAMLWIIGAMVAIPLAGLVLEFELGSLLPIVFLFTLAGAVTLSSRQPGSNKRTITFVCPIILVGIGMVIGEIEGCWGEWLLSPERVGDWYIEWTKGSQ